MHRRGDIMWSTIATWILYAALALIVLIIIKRLFF